MNNKENERNSNEWTGVVEYLFVRGLLPTSLVVVLWIVLRAVVANRFSEIICAIICAVVWTISCMVPLYAYFSRKTATQKYFDGLRYSPSLRWGAMVSPFLAAGLLWITLPKMEPPKRKLEEEVKKEVSELDYTQSVASPSDPDEKREEKGKKLLELDSKNKKSYIRKFVRTPSPDNTGSNAVAERLPVYVYISPNTPSNVVEEIKVDAAANPNAFWLNGIPIPLDLFLKFIFGFGFGGSDVEIRNTVLEAVGRLLEGQTVDPKDAEKIASALRNESKEKINEWATGVKKIIDEVSDIDRAAKEKAKKGVEDIASRAAKLADELNELIKDAKGVVAAFKAAADKPDATLADYDAAINPVKSELTEPLKAMIRELLSLETDKKYLSQWDLYQEKKTEPAKPQK